MKKPSNYFVLLVFIMFVGVSCKKGKKNTNNVVPNPSAPSTITRFDVNIDKYCPGSVGSIIYKASFFNNSHSVDSVDYILPDADVGDVILNDSNKFIKTGQGIYDYYIPATISEAFINSSKSWRITGNKSFPAISFTENYAIPKYQHGEVLPDTIYGLKENIIKLGSIAEADRVTIIFSTNTNVIPFIKTIALTDKELKLVPEDFEYYQYEIDGHCKCSIEILLSKTIYRSFRGKIIRFNSASSYVINSILKVD